MDERAKVLILDDEPIVGERLKPALERERFSVRTAMTGAEALSLLEREPYDILVTDLKMSGPDGMYVLQAAKRLQPAIKVVVITGFATRETYEEAIRSGAVEFIAKPFKISALKKLLVSLTDESHD